MKANSDRGLLTSIVFTALIGGLGGPFAHYALQEIPLFGYTFVRLLVCTVVMLIGFALTKTSPSVKNFILFAPVATLWWLNALLFSAGLLFTSATTGQFIHIAIPSLTAVVAYLLYRHKLTSRQWIGSGIALFGVGVVVLSAGNLSLFGSALFGNVMVVISAVSFAFYGVLSSRDAYKSISPREMIFIASACGTFVMLPCALLELRTSEWIGHVPLQFVIGMIIGVVAMSIFYLIFQHLMTRYGPSVASMNLYLLPIAVLIWSFIIFHQTASPIALIGATISCLGVIISSTKTKNRDSLSKL